MNSVGWLAPSPRGVAFHVCEGNSTSYSSLPLVYAPWASADVAPNVSSSSAPVRIKWVRRILVKQLLCVALPSGRGGDGVRGGVKVSPLRCPRARPLLPGGAGGGKRG